MSGKSKKSNKTDNKGQNANSVGEKAQANAPPLVNMVGSQQGQTVQQNSNCMGEQNSNCMGEACEVLYCPPSYMPQNGGYSHVGVQRPQKPQQPSYVYQHPQPPPQVPPFVQNSQYNQFGGPAIPVGNQQNSHVLANTSMNNNGMNDQSISDAPQWACTLINTLNTRLQNIETQISNQNQKWLSIDSQMQSQNSRMVNIEAQLGQMNDMKRSVGSVQ